MAWPLVRRRLQMPAACLLAVVVGMTPALSARAFAANLAVAVRDGEDRAMADAAVWAVRRGAAQSSQAVVGATIDQRDRTFVPYVSVVQTGTAVRFPNNDTVRHHVYSFSPAKVFSLKLYLGTPAEPVVFDRPGRVVLGCNIHDRMLAYVYVVDTPHFGVSGSDGWVRLENLHEGDWDVMVAHPDQEGEPVTSRIAISRRDAHHELRLAIPATPRKRMSPR